MYFCIFAKHFLISSSLHLLKTIDRKFDILVKKFIENLIYYSIAWQRLTSYKILGHCL